jgi:hypothetical protein
MAKVWLAMYVLLIVLFFVAAISWSRKKKREFNDSPARQGLTPTAKFFLKDLPPNFYVSIQGCVGFAAAALVASILYASIVQN